MRTLAVSVRSVMSDLFPHHWQDAEIIGGPTTHIEWTRPDGGERKEKVERWYRKQKIGQGAFGEVWLEVRREDDDVEKRAVKIIDKSRCRSR